MKKPRIGVYHPSPEHFLELIERVAQEATIRVCTEWDRIDEMVEEVDILLAFKFGFRPFPREMIVSASDLKWVQLSSAGIDHICPFDPEKLTVTNGSGVHGNLMSQYVFGALAHFMWDFPRLVLQQKERTWKRYPVRSLEGMTMAILGLGSIGRALARHAEAYEMRVVGTMRSP